VHFVLKKKTDAKLQYYENTNQNETKFLESGN